MSKVDFIYIKDKTLEEIIEKFEDDNNVKITNHRKITDKIYKVYWVQNE